MNYSVGMEIKSREIKINKYQSYYYAGASGDFNLIHIDNYYAKAAGLGGIILQGLCTMAYACNTVLEGNDPDKIKKLKVRFRQVVRPQDSLKVEGKVSSVEKSKISIDLLVKNQNEEQVITNGLAVLEI